MNAEELKEKLERLVIESTGDMFPVIYHETDLIERLVEFVKNYKRES